VIASAEFEEAEVRRKAPCPASFGQRDVRDEPTADFRRTRDFAAQWADVISSAWSKKARSCATILAWRPASGHGVRGRRTCGRRRSRHGDIEATRESVQAAGGDVTTVSGVTTGVNGRFIVNADGRHLSPIWAPRSATPVEAIQAGERWHPSVLGLFRYMPEAQGIELGEVMTTAAFRREGDDLTRYDCIRLEVGFERRIWQLHHLQHVAARRASPSRENRATADNVIEKGAGLHDRFAEFLDYFSKLG